MFNSNTDCMKIQFFEFDTIKKMSKLQWWIRNFMNSDSASYSLWLDSVLHHRSVNPEEGRSSLWSSSLSSLSRLVTALALYLLIHFFDSLSRDVLRWYYITVRTTFLLFLIRVRQWDYYLYIDHVSSSCLWFCVVARRASLSTVPMRLIDFLHDDRKRIR